MLRQFGRFRGSRAYFSKPIDKVIFAAGSGGSNCADQEDS
jgi:hypothetical protein